MFLLSRKKKIDTDVAVPEANNESTIDPITRVHGDPGEEVVVDSVETHGSPDASGTHENFHEVRIKRTYKKTAEFSETVHKAMSFWQNLEKKSFVSQNQFEPFGNKNLCNEKENTKSAQLS